MRFLLLTFLLAAPVFAGDDLDSLLEQLFSKDEAQREAARKALLANGDGVLSKLLERIEARQPKPHSLRIYDVADLRGDEENWKLVVARLRGAARGASTFTCGAGSSALAIAAPKAVHERVAKELDAVRKFHGTLVQIKVRILELGPGAHALPSEINEKDVAAFIERTGAKAVLTPSLTCRNGQHARLTTVEQVSYVKAFEVEEADGAFILNPTVGIAQGGITLDFSPVVARHGEAVRLVATATRSKLATPFPSIRVDSIIGKTGEIQVPESRSVTVTKLLTCNPGQATVLDFGDGQALLISATPIKIAEIGGRASAPAAERDRRPGEAERVRVR